MKREEYITDAQVVERAKAAVKIALDKNKVSGIPLVIYDSKTKKIYHKYY